MENQIFTYFISENENVIVEGLSKSQKIGKYNFLYDQNTPFSYFSCEQTECAVFGLAVNVLNGECDNLPEKILQKCKSVQDVVDFEKNLGGKYVILYKSGDNLYVLGDATCSIPVYYCTKDEFVCSSNMQFVLNQKSYSLDDEFNKIRKSGDISQAMPFDITPYKEVKQLIPNHYLSAEDKAAVRFINSAVLQTEVLVENAGEIVLPMINNLLKLYQNSYKIYCPITSGRDSRVVLSFLMSNGVEFDCYTIKHPNHTDKTQDITVPVEICAKSGLHHDLIEDVTVSDELKSNMDVALGEGHYSLKTLRIAQTVKEHCQNGAIINGDIIGQVGKCSLHRDIPKVFATPSYFRCKLHNYSGGAKKQLALWLKEIAQSGEKVNTFDLFSVENRMGRWAAQENLVYNTLGQVYLNIFNSRSIIYVWTAVARSERKLSKLHVDLINKTQPNLLEVDFEKDESCLIKLSKSSGLAYLASSYLKYYLEKMKFKG